MSSINTAGNGTAGTTGAATNTSNIGGGTGARGATSGQLNQVAHGIKEVFAKVHGAGEEIRGQFNGAVDGAFGENSEVAKNSAVATAGRNEMETGKFARETKQREGVNPGVGGERSV